MHYSCQYFLTIGLAWASESCNWSKFNSVNEFSATITGLKEFEYWSRRSTNWTRSSHISRKTASTRTWHRYLHQKLPANPVGSKRPNFDIDSALNGADSNPQYHSFVAEQISTTSQHVAPFIRTGWASKAPSSDGGDGARKWTQINHEVDVVN